MKNQPDYRKTETLEDIVFEGRNKSYGAFDLNRKRNKYLFTAFLISFIGVSTAIAVPFLNSFKNTGNTIKIDEGVEVTLAPVDNVKPEIPLPPEPPPLPENMERQVIYTTPEVVDVPVDPLDGFTLETIDKAINPPPDIEMIPVVDATPTGIEEPKEEIVLNPQEAARFRGGDYNDFREWVAQNIVFPAIAVEVGIKGKVFVEFCVNSKGEVVDVKILKKLDPAIDAETIRVITSSPKWAPAKQGGTPVKTRFVIPFMFDLL